jgi:tetratricopeptide (TPR) repeat protein
MIFFPTLQCEQPLTEIDFSRFFLPFSQILKNTIPTASEIIFLTKHAELESYIYTVEKKKIINNFLLQAEQNPDKVCTHDDSILLPFPLGGSLVVAIIQGVDPFLVQKADNEWLIEARNTALSDFALLKRQRIDQDTGLLNAANLHDILGLLKHSTDVALMLIELYPKVRSAAEAIQFSRRAAFSLTNFADNRFPIHYLGHGIFAFVIENEKKESASHIGAMLISGLRKEKYPRVHIGCSRNDGSQTKPRPESLYDTAWQALQVACRRGPFSFCDFSLLAHPEQHPLRRPSRQVLAKFFRKWRNSEKFSIVQFQSDNREHLYDHLAASFKSEMVYEKDDIFILLDGMDPTQALEWVRLKIKAIKKKIGKDALFSAGIGSYPFADFAKSEIPYNCRKALLHAAFFGPGSVVVFDAVSLNISGDIFYSDGDLESAVREYKRGLVCDDNNVNLLNSLGVAYAMMDKSKMACQCFNKVLAFDTGNFMAHYNLGLGEELLGHDKSALTSFERAISVHPGGSELIDIKKDLQFQMGRLYCSTGDFQKAINMLFPWLENAKGAKIGGRAFRYLGKSFHGLQMKTEAVTWLQRALQFDEFDAEALGLLGELYLEQGEGNEIALSLCEKSVELSPHNLQLRLRLAKVQTACRQYTAAQHTLRACVRNRETRADAQLQNGLICQELGRTKTARSWFSKVLDQSNVAAKTAETARNYLNIYGR